jgi:hypothetical protein
VFWQVPPAKCDPYAVLLPSRAVAEMEWNKGRKDTEAMEEEGRKKKKKKCGNDRIYLIITK